MRTHRFFFFVLVFNSVFGLSVIAQADTTNIAPFGTASQSSTAFGGVAELAIDGNTGGVFFGDGTTHTTENGTDLTPFWELAFPRDFPIDTLAIWNRTDCCGGRLSDLTITIFDDNVEVYNSFTDTGDFINPGNVLGGPTTIDIDLLGTVGSQTGDRIRIQKEGQVLSLAEVQVFSDTDLEPFPVLEIVRQTGDATLRNKTLAGIDISGYSIRSTAGNLDPTNWLSIAENYDADSGGSVDSDDNWVELTSASSDRDISEATLGTTTLIADGAPIDLGSIWTPNPTEDDITSRLLLGDGVTTLNVDVLFVDQAFSAADFDQSGSVDGGDFLTWQRNFGATGASNAQGDANNDTNVNGLDLAIWEEQFGDPVGGAVSSLSAVPEPTTFLMVLMGVGLVLVTRPKNGIRGGVSVMCRNRSKACFPLLVVALCGLLSAQTMAAFTIDRDYQLGDDGQEDASSGIDLGSGPANVADGFTLDSDGTPDAGDFQDLQVFGTPTYVDVTGRPMGGTGLGAKFESGDYLLGLGLGFPQGNAPNPNANYNGIFTRGFSGWIKPDASGLGNAMRQDVVVDTGQWRLYIDEDDKFGLRHGVIGLDPPEREVTSELTAVADTWYHFQVHSFGTQPGVLYIDGRAVAIVDTFYGGGAAGTEMVLGANQSQDGNFFSGTLDDVIFYVAGTNDDDFNFGDFDILQDNPFMAEALAGFADGDLNGDGQVMGDGSGGLGAADDVKTFVDNWLFENAVPGSNLENASITLTAGDMETRLRGDFNLDGITDLLDWGILRNLHPDGDSLNLEALLQTRAVPEPSAFVLLSLASAALIASRRR